MDKSEKENIAQSEIEGTKESALHESITDDKDSANDSASSTVEDLSASESCKDSQASDPNDESSSSNYEGEAEFKNTEVIESTEDIGNHQHFSLETNIQNYTTDDMHRNATSSNNVNLESNSYTTQNVRDTRQASDSLASKSCATSGEKTQSSEDPAIPSTSKGSSESAHAAESSPKRPTNFGRNVKQAIHVFYPINPKSILMKVPIPMHSGRWVYLRDSPESSDYGGSTETLDDPLLMEALDGESPIDVETVDEFTPRNEEIPPCLSPIESPIDVVTVDEFTPRNEEMPSCPPPIENPMEALDDESPIDVVTVDAFTPRNEEMPTCLPPIENPILDDESLADDVEEAVGGLLSSLLSHPEICENAKGDHATRNTGDYLHEPSSEIEETVEVKPTDTENRSFESDNTERTFRRPKS